MNTELILQVQAYLDNELDQAETRRVANLVATDGDAARLYKELKDTRALLAGNELGAKVPDTREFYWSRIQQQIEREENQSVRTPERSPWWIRLLAPIAGVACVIVLLVGTGVLNSNSGKSAYLSESHVAADDDASGITFHSQSQGVTVVWVDSSQQ